MASIKYPWTQHQFVWHESNFIPESPRQGVHDAKLKC